MHSNNKPKSRPGQVVDILPLALPTDEAGPYIGHSPSWMRATRNTDRRLMEQGRPPIGPPWRVLGKTVMYLRSDLEAWLLANSVERGSVKFRGTPAEVEP
jgi:hypothetical protein